jgi:predicted transcriptional regulator
MNLNEIITISEGEVLTPELDTNVNIHGGCCADLMSDVLAYSRPRAVLLTGLTNPQVVRTAQIADFRAIIFIRGKKPQPETIEIAIHENIPLISSPLGMFELSGKLHDAGLKSYESNGSN